MMSAAMDGLIGAPIGYGIGGSVGAVAGMTIGVASPLITRTIGYAINRFKG